jgi:hypothetical protein
VTGYLIDLEYPDARVLMTDGERWSVREATRLVPKQAIVLVFDHPDLMRIVPNFPPAWRELSDRALFALSLER